MLKELLKKLQQRELTEQQEQELLSQMQVAKGIIQENASQRVIQKAKLDKISKDQTKLKNLDELEEKIELVEKKIRSHECKFELMLTLFVLLTIFSGVASFVLVMNIFTSVLLQILSPFAATLCMVPAVFIGNKMNKTFIKFNEELNELRNEKQTLLNEVNVDMEKLVMNNLKLTNLPIVEHKTQKVNEAIVNTEETCLL